MGGVTLFSIPKAVTVKHFPEANACVAQWEQLSSPHFRDAVSRGLGECKRLRARSWIVDISGENPGVPTQSDFAWVSSDAVDLARENGLRAVINIHGKSAIATMGARRFSRILTDGGFPTYDCTSLRDALELAKEIAEGKAGVH